MVKASPGAASPADGFFPGAVASAAGSSTGPQPHAPAPSTARPRPVPASRTRCLRDGPRSPAVVPAVLPPRIGMRPLPFLALSPRGLPSSHGRVAARRPERAQANRGAGRRPGAVRDGDSAVKLRTPP
ncbi:hypothetical protein GCM10010497_32310 [Streptomyces cinereoruber]|uniref:Uncharacterized protein n=1 Tax=Streptomyces cinereoruber TaxID=67260 RepID=A0AAV4KJ56_9ACTN|nr:hypothetical protein GCM10010497_32310 [Streptomyces cinereoruber]